MSRLLLVLFALSACRNKDVLPESPADDSPATDDSAPADDSAPPTDADDDGYHADEDCDDNDATIHPGAEEDCDAVDRNCDGDPTAGATDTTAYYSDNDRDGYGDGEPTMACDQPPDTATADGDCNDSDPAFHPGADESDCTDPNDYNCDGSVGYADGDGDGYAACEECDDTNAGIHPGAEEVCDGIDQDCDGTADQGVTTTYYQDSDGDGYGDADFTAEACAQPEGYADNDDDCDDSAAAVNLAATEVCDGIDNDCDLLIDDADPTLDSASAGTWYADSDSDGYGDPNAATDACVQPANTVSDDQDCDDGDNAVHPGATEVCDGIDNDCDGSTDPSSAADASTWYADSDSDGYGDAAATLLACDQPSGAVADATDCDDGDGDVHPGATEVCNGVDDDCDNTTDPVGSWWDTSYDYRIPLTLVSPASDIDGPPVALTVDFRAALDALGDSGAFDPDSVRVVVQDCSAGQPELPSQWEDGVAGLFEKADHSDPLGDEVGDLFFVWDGDGDLSSLETVSAGSTANLAIYFGTSGSAPGYASGLVSTSSSLQNNVAAATFSSSAGGLLSALTLGGSSSLMSQEVSCCGNGSFSAGTWSTTPMYTSGTLALDVDGSVLGLVETTGNIGGYDFTYWYWMFDGRPELWSKTYQVTNGSITLNHGGHFTSGIRPWESQQQSIGGGTYTIDSTGYLYADSSNGSYGVAFGYLHAPNYMIGLTAYNPYLISLGNDYADASAPSTVTLGAGEVLMDHPVMVVVPHTGDYADVESALFALMEGVSVSTDSPEAR